MGVIRIANAEFVSICLLLSQCRIKIEQSRLLVIAAAKIIDNHGAKAAKSQIAMAKVSR